ncbi:MAG: hypothetical protein JNK12_22315 [Acidimicrobiales bacterium]|nr:hypothetical protein [Acidimicrobiales bacterium]
MTREDEMHDATPETLEVTARAGVFLDTLEPGDVLLFQGADFLAGLAQLTERRTCYHSAIYVGTGQRDGRTEHLLAHNVSTLWWRDLARQVPGEGGSLHPGDEVDVVNNKEDRAKFFDVLARNLVEHHLFDRFHRGDDALLQLARQLVEHGGVGVVSIEGYLARRKTEPIFDSAGERTGAKYVHHVRSVLALRHHQLRTELEVDAAAGELLLAASGTADRASGFNAAELLSVVPQCFDRPGYIEWAGLRLLAEQQRNRKNLARLLRRRLPRGQEPPSALDIVRERLRTIEPAYYFPEVDRGPGWICASYVIATYAAAGMPLDVGHVEGVKMGADDGQQVDLSTPRDLWDCPQLTPHTMFVRGPERWDEGPAARPERVEEPIPVEEPDRGVEVGVGQATPAVFIARATEPLSTTTRISAEVDVPVVAGPSTRDEAIRRALEKLEWRWSTAPIDEEPADLKPRLLRRGIRRRPRRRTR